MSKAKLITVLASGMLIVTCTHAQLPADQKSKLRYEKDRFAGLHFDFHAQKNDTAIGKTFTYAMVDSLLTIVKPDFIQVDCKGHQGYSSYPTKVGNPPSAFRKDIMRMWREVTEKYNTPVFVHYSGVWDVRALELHPGWNRQDTDSSPDVNMVSVLSPYVKELLIPQMKELAVDYKMDGAWIDGDCWALSRDYSPAVLAAFTKETGITEIPRHRSDPHFFEFSEFNRKIFRNYITSYINAVHEVNPRFKMTSNWSFSSMMPEKVDVPVDFLSGDVAGVNSLYSSAFESRCMALQGKPWDLMSWGFVIQDDMMGMKSVTQLEQEGAEVLAMGGGFQTYWQQNHDGSIAPYLFSKMAEIIKFCQDRKEYCYKSEIVPQIGLLYSTYAWKRISDGGLYSAHSLEPMKGIMSALLDNHLPVEILMDHHLPGRLEKYPLLVLPEWENIDPAIHQQLLAYVKNGGKLLIVGAKAATAFEPQLGVKLMDKVHEDTTFYAGLGKNILHLKTDFLPVSLQNGTTATGVQLNVNDWRFNGKYPLASIQTLGKGKIAAIYMDMGAIYSRHKNYLVTELLKTMVQQMQPGLLSEISGATNIHQVVSTKNGKLYIHLVNTGGPHDNPNSVVYESIDALNNIQVKVSLAQKPKSIQLQPGNIRLNYTYANGAASIHVPEVGIYNIIEIGK